MDITFRLLEDQWVAWYELTPQERWRETQKLWSLYLAADGTLESESDGPRPAGNNEVPKSEPPSRSNEASVDSAAAIVALKIDGRKLVGAMDEGTRHSLVQVLGREMSDISEECYCAGWLGGTEYFVPELSRRAAGSGQKQYWGHGEVTPERARGLIALADLLGTWADLDTAGTGYTPFEPFPLPAQYIDALDQEQAAGVSRQRMRGADCP